MHSALQWLREQLPSMEKELAKLVEINSFTTNIDGCHAMAKQLEKLFTMEGLSATFHHPPGSAQGPHLLFCTSASGAEVSLVGHLDTVFPPGVFEGYRVDGPLRRGPGVLDMKGGLIVMAFALRALAHEGLLSSIPLRTIIVSDEEIGSPEGRTVIEENLKNTRAALIFEAGRTQDALITCRKGTGTIVAVASGKKAHAGNLHHEGVNAVWALACFVDEAQRLTDYKEGITLNVGKFSGGEVANTVPDHAEALIDLRYTSMEQGQNILARLEEAARRAEMRVPGACIQLRGGLKRQPMQRSEANLRLMRSYAPCALAEGLGTSEAPLLGGGSDACTTSALGIASLDGLGPRGNGFHTLDEQIEVATLIPKAAALVRFLAAWPTQGL